MRSCANCVLRVCASTARCSEIEESESMRARAMFGSEYKSARLLPLYRKPALRCAAILPMPSDAPVVTALCLLPRPCANQQTNKTLTQTVHKWSVWRRYSEFEELEKALQKQLGWQMERVGEFVPKNNFSFSKLSAEFVETRRAELDTWWAKVMRIDKVCDFTKHHCSRELKVFLDVQSVVDRAEGTSRERATSISGDADVPAADGNLEYATSIS